MMLRCATTFKNDPKLAPNIPENINLFLRGSCYVSIATEGMSIYENLSEIGVKLPYTKYFEKLKERKNDK